MTRLVVSLTAAAPEDAIAAARALGPDDADLVECRLDHLTRVDAEILRALADAAPGRALATFRPKREGGLFEGPEGERERVLLTALDAGFAAVDVEHDAPFTERVIGLARRRGALAILSKHDFDKTPPAEDVVKFAEDAQARGADVAKFASRVDAPADADALVTAALTCRERGLRVALMAVNDAFLRLLAPTLGLALAYAAPPETTGAAAAPGQLPAPRVRSAHTALTPRAFPHPRPVLLFGDPVAHSASPAFQNAAFRAVGVPATYVPARVPTERLGAAVDTLRTLDALGANVTVPHKIAVLAHVDAVDATARAAGAANTLVQQDGRVTAFNTDGAGALDALAEAGVNPARERVLVLGAGGAARAVVHALADTGAAVTITNRTRKKAEDVASDVDADVVEWDAREHAVASATLVVNATTIGLHEGDASPVPADALKPTHAVMDAVYARGGTPLVRAARDVGCRAVVAGEAMLLHQGARAFALWTGKRAPLATMRDALEEAMRE